MSTSGRPGGTPARLRVALVGCGQWGLNYLRVIMAHPDCEVTVACDPDPQRRAMASAVVRDLATVADLDAVLGDADVDALVVATPAADHHQTVRKALLSGKDCLVEKPLTTATAHARELADLAADRCAILMVGHVFRYNAAVDYVATALRQGLLGDLQYINCTRTNLGPIRSDVSVVWDLMTHDVSILLHLLGSPSWVAAQGAAFLRDGCHDVAFATLGFESGVVANIRASWLDPRKVREITLVGTAKMLFIDDLNGAEPVRIYDKGAVKVPDTLTFGEYKMATRTGDVVVPFVPVSEPLQNQWRHFVECVSTRRTPLSDAEDGVRVVETLAAIDRSIAAAGGPVRLLDPAAQEALA